MDSRGSCNRKMSLSVFLTETTEMLLSRVDSQTLHATPLLEEFWGSLYSLSFSFLDGAHHISQFKKNKNPYI